MRSPRDLVRRYGARRSAGDAAHAALLERLDRINHWVVHVDARQQELVVATAELRAELGTLRASVHAGQAEATAAAARAERRLAGLERTLAAVTEQVAGLDPPPLPQDGPLVTVVCAVRDRADLFDRALACVQSQTYSRWECLVVDDGSTDVDDAVLARWRADERVRVVQIEPAGAAAARNRGVAEATGEIIAYLDADNTMHPTYLARVVDALDRHPQASWAVTTQLVVDDDGVAVRDDRVDLARLEELNHFDLGAVAHRRAVLDVIGAFDPSFTRLSDWDLVQRLAATAGEPVRIAALGSTYDNRRPDSISRRVPLHPNFRRLVDRHRGRPAEGLRVLFAEWHYPQVSETYMRADVVGLQALGAHVEAWSEEDVAVGYEPGIPVHRGELADAIEAVRPDIVVAHWLHIGRDLRAQVRAAGLPLAVRGHGFDYDAAVLDELLADAGVVVHAFPHHIGMYGRAHPRLVPLITGFDQELFPPATGKDRRLVVRTGAGLRTKDFDTFLEVARACPEHRFVLALCHAYRIEGQTEEVIARRDELGAPVEILVDLPHEKAADLVAEAGTYLHTHGTSHPIGMPISIMEAMGTGCYTLVRDLPGMHGYVGDAAGRYDDAATAAALIQQTLHWSDDQWSARWRAASDHAHIRYGAADVMLTMLRQWDEVLGVRPR